ncbi:SRS domain-containing protein [Neospora caninum Liverpool]|uniref:SRS domain-containing protein n=1 Tax=Neospora caninum (strain Liverpool) TaxID=572307 RepID=F0VNU2_NEOCL|nr:SRS domain-containing protein [Neospora caninum Liverpool]CBZ55388.1 SRS domain-containing protein [Neospora caninum Liverpool]CEL70124.1 TPA: SRS domain-containing protein [Neospora caninum Liverpool]|eukprot:XP_003885416.1 SRS domain-containing protein [Neospora caninum Liverpool]
MAGTRAFPTQRRMAGALFLVGAVLASSAVLGSNGQSDKTPPHTCTSGGASQGISVTVDTKTKTATFVCDTDINNVLPSPSGTTLTKYYADKALGKEKEEELATFFGQGSQATITQSQRNPTGKSTVELTLGKLPETIKTIYFGCSDKAASREAGRLGTGVGGHGARRLAAAKAAAAAGNKCVVTVTVPADPAANSKPELCYIRFKVFCGILVKHSFASFSLRGGRVCHFAPGCCSPMSAACTVAKKNMDLEITNESKSVSFQCDTNVGNLTPANPADLIFDESCQNPVKLADMLPSAKLATSTSGYTFSVEELPETAATFCYKCSAVAADKKEAPEEGSNACNVKIHVSAANLDSAASSVATTRSVPLLTSGLAISFLFFPVVL